MLPTLVVWAALVHVLVGANVAPFVSHKISESEAEILAYWTPERMQSAIPMPLERDVSSGQIGEPVGPDGPPDFTKPSEGLNKMTQDNDSLLLGAPVPVANPNTYPWSVIGKVFFTRGGLNYVCSGTAVNSNTVLSAGHCVYSAGVWATSFAFYPAWPTTTPAFAATRLYTSSAWVSGSYSGDYSAATFGTVAKFNALGWWGTTWNAAIVSGTPFIAYGYPQAAPYNGNVKYQASGGAVVPQIPVVNAGTVEMYENSMTGGCSGGPWANQNIGANYANGVNSFGYGGWSGYMYSPYFDTAFGSWINYVISVQLT